MKAFEVKSTIPLDEIESLVISAFEGGANYWYRIESDTKGDYLKQAFTKSGIVVSDFVGNDGKIEHKGRLNPTTMRRALTLMAKEYPHILTDVVSGNSDAATGDVFLQLAVLGKVIYG